VYSPCRYGEINSFYCFSPLEFSKSGNEGWNYEASKAELLDPYPNLDPKLLAIFQNSTDIKPWRLWLHEPYTHWHKGLACIMGDAAHPMMPDQSQGACQSIEDAAALGIIFSKNHGFTTDISNGLELFQRVRKPRATRVQAASARARDNITERIGFSSNVTNPTYKVANENEKLTIEEMNL
jgi:salicylate hydroxylase